MLVGRGRSGQVKNLGPARANEADAACGMVPAHYQQIDPMRRGEHSVKGDRERVAGWDDAIEGDRDASRGRFWGSLRVGDYPTVMLRVRACRGSAQMTSIHLFDLRTII